MTLSSYSRSRKLFQGRYLAKMLQIARITAPLYEIGVAKHVSNIKFEAGSRNMAVLYMCGQYCPKSALSTSQILK